MPYADPVKRRQYQNGRNAAARSAAIGIQKALEGADIAIPDTAVTALRLILLSKGLSTLKTVSKVKQKFNAKAFRNVDGELQPVPDNDAQLKAVEIAMELQTRAGLLPSEKQSNGSGNITINVISYTQDTPRIIEVQSNQQDTE